MKPELKKFLLVDDDEDLHVIVKMCLSSLSGVEMLSAYSGEQAIQMAIEHHPDLILLDVMMPKMDGIATLKAMRLIPNLMRIPIAFITAKAQKYEIDEYLKMDIAGVIVKPFNPVTLAQDVAKIWDSSTNSHS